MGRNIDRWGHIDPMIGGAVVATSTVRHLLAAAAALHRLQCSSPCGTYLNIPLNVLEGDWMVRCLKHL